MALLGVPLHAMVQNLGQADERLPHRRQQLR